MSLAQLQALDAADGRMDGSYFGQKIVQGGHVGSSQQSAAAQAAAAAAYALDAADGRIDGTYFGRSIVAGNTTHVTKQPDPYEVKYFYTNTRDPCMLPMIGDNEHHRFDDIVQVHQYKGTPWEDTTEFNLPNHTSGREEPPSLLLPHQIALWRHHVPYLKGDDPTEVRVGPYAGPSFPAALQGLLSLGKERISDLFGRIHEGCGVFEVKLSSWVQGLGWVPLKICVDAKIPICPNSCTPAFSYSERHNELWPIFLEKAFVKSVYNGKGYVAFSNAPGQDSISPALILSHLCSCQSEVYTMAGKVTPQAIVDLLNRHVELTHVVFVKIRESIDARKSGLIPMMYYVVVDVKEVAGIGGVTHRIIQLQHPYGTNAPAATQWKGSYSLYDQTLNEALAEILDIRRFAAEGQFYLDANDAAAFISEVHVAELLPRVAEGDKDLVTQLRNELFVAKSQLSRAEGALRSSGINVDTATLTAPPPGGYRDEMGSPAALSNTFSPPAAGPRPGIFPQSGSAPFVPPPNRPSTNSFPQNSYPSQMTQQSFPPTAGAPPSFGGPPTFGNSTFGGAPPAGYPGSSPMSNVGALNHRFAPSYSSVQSTSAPGSPGIQTRRSVVSSASTGRR